MSMKSKIVNVLKRTGLTLAFPALIFVVMLIISVYLCAEMLVTLDWVSITGIVAVYGVGVIYTIVRIRYLKANGVDLLDDMKKPFEPWEERERSYQ